ncbi:hypothetical protein D0Z00_004194 [Geotrichum galactomycetum]|uniref:Uncharacterized protein n=1 Tax=Geotrichum galactomycetum TaxID=27317 RepID=A0ACB6UZE9_9ASCO|nr:hypothetical protein D0Z00_004194 [Geotrichum candidum]
MTEAIETPTYDETLLDKITEGKASILFPKGNRVFYNPIQQFNRDISVLGIRAWSEIFEAERKSKKASKNNNNNNSKRKGGNKESESSPKFTKVSETEKVAAEVANEPEAFEPEAFEPATSELVQEKSTEKQQENTTTVEPNSTVAKPHEPKPYIEIIEALSASGLRAIRYALEIPKIKTVIANDFSASAVESIKQNSQYSGADAVVQPNEGDACVLMYQHKNKPVHVVDLDPYGSATPFMDSAVQSIRDGGLMLVTCTDLAVLAGNSYPEKCFSQYGGQTLHSDASHESALRLVLNMVASTAAKYGKSIEPLLSLSIDFYVRLFIRIKTSPLQVKQNAHNTMIVYQCTGCGTFTKQHLGKAVQKNNNFKYGYARGPTVSERCAHCDSTHIIAGPMWGGPIHNKAYIDKMLEVYKDLDTEVYKTTARIEGMLTLAKDELIDVPFYFSPQNIASIVRSSSPPHRKIVSALCNAGYQVSFTHALAGGIKTDAPFIVIWDIFRQWIKEAHNGETSKNLKAASPGTKIVESLESASGLTISFDDHPRALELEKFRKSKVVRYQENPTKNWGPKAKASKN